MGPEVGERGVGEEGQKKGLWSRSSKMQRLVSPAHTGESTYNTLLTFIVCAKGRT